MKYHPDMSDDIVFCWGCDVRTKVATKDDPHDQVIRMYFTTRRLSRIGPQIDGSVNVDPTYKVNREGCKAVIVGLQDAARHFHVGGIGVLSQETTEDITWLLQKYKESRLAFFIPAMNPLHVVRSCKVDNCECEHFDAASFDNNFCHNCRHGSSNHTSAYVLRPDVDQRNFRPKALIADASDAISKSAELVLNETTRIMCYFHVTHNVKKYFGACKSAVQKSVKTEFLEDIKCIHNAWSKRVKVKAISLFRLKWNAKCIEPGLEYMSHILQNFLDSWVDKVRTSLWSVCDVTNCMNADNNGLESFNKVIKEDITHHVQLPLMQLYENIGVFLQTHSVEHNDGVGVLFTRPFKTEPQPTVGDYRLSYEVATSNSVQYKIKMCKTTGICITLNSRANLNLNTDTFRELLHQYKELHWETFDEYKAFKFKVYVIENIDGRFRCSCDFFAKKHHCYHEYAVRWRFFGQVNIIPTAHQQTSVKDFQPTKKGRPPTVPTVYERTPTPLAQQKATGSPTKV
jgi:hypothetical protein